MSLLFPVKLSNLRLRNWFQWNKTSFAYPNDSLKQQNVTNTMRLSIDSSIGYNVDNWDVVMDWTWQIALKKTNKTIRQRAQENLKWDYGSGNTSDWVLYNAL